jgi:hypothetical protein
MRLAFEPDFCEAVAPEGRSLLLATDTPQPTIRPARPLPSLRESCRNHTLGTLYHELSAQGVDASVATDICRECKRALEETGLPPESTPAVLAVRAVIDVYRQRGLIPTLSPCWVWDGGASASPLARPLTKEHHLCHAAFRDKIIERGFHSPKDADHLARRLIHAIRDHHPATPEAKEILQKSIDDLKARGLLKKKDATVADYRSRFASMLDGDTP